MVSEQPDLFAMLRAFMNHGGMLTARDETVTGNNNSSSWRI